jgi:hypothetical protein
MRQKYQEMNNKTKLQASNTGETEAHLMQRKEKEMCKETQGTR